MTPDLFSQDFTVPFNQHKGNQTLLSENRKHFSGQAKIILNLLLSGRSVSSHEMFAKYNIVDVRARIFSLRKKGYAITDCKIPFGNGAKEWKMTEENINLTKNICDQKTKS